jgi:hypothetical protein
MNDFTKDELNAIDDILNGCLYCGQEPKFPDGLFLKIQSMIENYDKECIHENKIRLQINIPGDYNF